MVPFYLPEKENQERVERLTEKIIRMLEKRPPDLMNAETDENINDILQTDFEKRIGI